MSRRIYADYARPRTRFVNFLVDNIIFNLSTAGLILVVGLVLGLSAGEDQMLKFTGFFGGIGGKIVLLLAYIAYYTLTESFWGRSPAKFLTRTRVIDPKGGDADWMTIIGRTLFRLIPFEPVSFLLGGDWHDRFSNTCVVYDRG